MIRFQGFSRHCEERSDEAIQKEPSPEFVNSQSFINKFFPQLCNQAHTYSLRCVGSLCFPEVKGNSNLTDNSLCKRCAFTLAEVLITLAIIGIVAALTIPPLMQNYKEKQTVSKLKSTYSILHEAVRLMVAENGTVDKWGPTAETRKAKFEELLPRYVNIQKKCKKITRGCINTQYKNRFNSSTDAGISTNSNSYLLRNNAGIRIITNGAGLCTQDMTMTKTYTNPDNKDLFFGTYALDCIDILIDINGPAEPNTFNIDAFNFKVVQDGLIPAGSALESVWTETFDAQCLGKDLQNKNGYAKCSAWVIYNGNMDYLHCPDSLSWNGKHSCKN